MAIVLALGVSVVWRFCFFFQAEDGIRDVAVTGVQTCALPISVRLGEGARHDRDVPAGPHPARLGRVVPSARYRHAGLYLSAGGAARHADGGGAGEIGRAAWRGRGEILGGGGLFKKKKKDNDDE